MNDIVKRLKEKVSEHNVLERELQKTEDLKIKYNKSIEEKVNLKKENQDVLDATKLILERLTYESKGRLENFLSNALSQIFPDRNYELKLILREDTVRPGLEITLIEDGIEQEITDAVGGGILSTLGLLMQVYYIENYGLNKVIFIDEGLAPVSDAYLVNIMSFLKFISEGRQYKIVVVTHKELVTEYADFAYKVERGKIEALKGETIL